jgi:hypothetical protein
VEREIHGGPRHSGEQSRARKRLIGENKGGDRTITSSGDLGAHERRLGRGEDAGQLRRFSSGARNALVSVDRMNQRGRR